MTDDDDDLPRRLARQVRARGGDREDFDQEAQLAYLTVKAAWDAKGVGSGDLIDECNIARVVDGVAFLDFARKYIRRSLKRLKRALERERDLAAWDRAEVADPLPGPVAGLITEEFWEGLSEYLTPRQHLVILHHYRDRNSLADTADILDLKYEAVKKIHGRAISMLRMHLDYNPLY